MSSSDEPDTDYPGPSQMSFFSSRGNGLERSRGYEAGRSFRILDVKKQNMPGGVSGCDIGVIV